MRSSRSSVSLYASMALLLSLVSGAAFGGQSVMLADGVLVDTENRLAYVMAPGNGIDAIALTSGEHVWTSDVVAKPLVVVGDLLIAQGLSEGPGQLDLLSFDTRTGQAGRLSARVDLPADVLALLSDGPRSSFRVTASLDNDGVVLSWRSTKAGSGDEFQGYLPAEEEGLSPIQKAANVTSGATRLDLATGKVAPTKAQIARQPLDSGQLAGVKGRLFTSADGRHLLASRRRADGGIWESYRWTILSRKGANLGELSHFASAAPFVMADTNLIFVSQPYMRAFGDEVVDEPLTLRAVNLADGSELWAKSVQDPRFDGPYAP